MPECVHCWVPIALYGGGVVKQCAFCAEDYSPEAVDISELVDTCRQWLGLGLYSEQEELLERLRMRWEDGQDPGIPERVARLLR